MSAMLIPDVNILSGCQHPVSHVGSKCKHPVSHICLKISSYFIIFSLAWYWDFQTKLDYVWSNKPFFPIDFNGKLQIF